MLKYIKLLEYEYNLDDTLEEMNIAYTPIDYRNFVKEWNDTWQKVYCEFPYNESVLDSPDWTDVLFEMGNNGWNIYWDDSLGYDIIEAEHAEILRTGR